MPSDILKGLLALGAGASEQYVANKTAERQNLSKQQLADLQYQNRIAVEGAKIEGRQALEEFKNTTYRDQDRQLKEMLGLLGINERRHATDVGYQKTMDSAHEATARALALAEEITKRHLGPEGYMGPKGGIQDRIDARQKAQQAAIDARVYSRMAQAAASRGGGGGKFGNKLGDEIARIYGQQWIRLPEAFGAFYLENREEVVLALAKTLQDNGISLDNRNGLQDALEHVYNYYGYPDVQNLGMEVDKSQFPAGGSTQAPGVPSGPGNPIMQYMTNPR